MSEDDRMPKIAVPRPRPNLQRLLMKKSAAKVALAALIGDPAAIEILREATNAVGEALAHVITLLAPRCVVLGGGVSLIEPSLWLVPIRERVLDRAFPLFARECRIESAALGEEVVVHGTLSAAKSMASQSELFRASIDQYLK